MLRVDERHPHTHTCDILLFVLPPTVHCRPWHAAALNKCVKQHRFRTSFSAAGLTSSSRRRRHTAGEAQACISPIPRWCLLRHPADHWYVIT